MTSLLLITFLAALGLSAAADSVVVRSITDPVEHGEGTYWDDHQHLLYFVDISGQKLHCFDPVTGIVTGITLEGGGVTLVVPVADAVGDLMVTRGHDLLEVLWDCQSDEPQSVQVITSVEDDKPGNRFNDGKADSSGRLWLGTMGPEPTPGEVTPDQGSLYSVETDSNDAVKHLGPVSVSNGLIWSDDDKLMYYIDSPTEHVDVFDYDIFTGNISNRRTIFDLTANDIPGVPDGMTIDKNGNLWVAIFNGARVINVNSTTGQLIRSVDIPAERVTDVVFGGLHLDILYVTTSRLDMTEEELAKQPLAGTVFEVTGLGVSGLPGQTVIRNVPSQ